MDTKELRALMEAYQQVYAPIDEAITSEKGKAKAAAMIAARSTPSGRAKSGQGDTVSQIKHISRSDKEGLGGTPATRSTSGSNRPKSYSGMGGTGNKAARRAGLTPTREKPNAWKEEVDIFDTVLEFLQVEGYAETLEQAEWMMANVIDEKAIAIVIGEAQHARENPEKYEAGEKKKYAPVRGERTPMPPRGDKRREDFEKWYRANVR